MTAEPERLQVRQVSDRGRWNETLKRLPRPHVLQTWEWGAFKEQHDWEAEHWVWEQDEVPRAAALILTRTLGKLPLSVMYIPKGPVLDYGDLSLLGRTLGDLQKLTRRRRALFVKIDPDVASDASEGKEVAALLRHQGWRASQEQIQFRNTLLLDLTPTPDEILADMKSKWRYNVRLAGRKGVTVRSGSLEDLDLLYEMYLETSKRNHFVIRPQEYYEVAWGSFIQADLAHPLIAEVEGEPVAMMILFRFGELAWYMYGASRSMHRDRMPNHLLQWEAIQWARSQGCTVYDLWGAPDQLDESDPMWGVYRFKKGFGAKFVRHIGAYDYPTSSAGYWLYTAALPRILALMRLHHWRSQR